jgi:hypothetical protein
MTAEVIEGEIVEEPRALTIVEPREMLAETITPEGTVSLATRMATALKDIVEKQRLYAVIQGKKYPQVEAWMTIARMDNVVAREVLDGILRHEDGSYEATVELIRLSDGMVIGRGSALCGTKGDAPWEKRPEPARRSMAVTRATSRAFRQQYSWIMALAGYEPTPADEMPHDAEQRPVGAHQTPPPRPEMERLAENLVGTVEAGKPPVDMQLRIGSDDQPAWGFKLKAGTKGYQALAVGELADALSVLPDLTGQTVRVWGKVEMVPWQKGGKDMPPFARIAMTRIQTDDYTLPAQAEAESVPLFRDDDLGDLDF